MNFEKNHSPINLENAPISYILITGGLGYIGSHIANKLLETKNKIIIIDNKDNLTLVENWKYYIDNQSLIIKNLDMSNNSSFHNLMEYNITGVIHCAALKSVPRSINEPLLYYKNNMNSLINLLEFMNKKNIKTIIYSSSATVYSGNIKTSTFSENDASFPTTPYGNTKIMCEKILEDLHQSDKSWKIISLRYFNPAVCYLNVEQGDTGLFTAVEKVITKKLPFLSIFGDNYDTHDGSCIRDYIHINDLVDSHICALNFLMEFSSESGVCEAVNVGTGTGYSTLDVAKEFEKIDSNFQYKIVSKREGDAAISISICDKAKLILNWSSQYSLHDICNDIYKTTIKRSLQ